VKGKVEMVPLTRAPFSKTPKPHRLKAKTKFTIAALALGLGIWGFLEARKAAANFALKVTGYGTPRFSGAYSLVIPVNLQVNNPTPLPVNIDSMNAEVYLLKSGTWLPVGFVNVTTPVLVAPGKTTHAISPVLNLQNIGTISMAELKNIFATGELKLRTVISARYGALNIKPAPFESKIDIPKITFNV
jgi:hypothetical protein